MRHTDVPTRDLSVGTPVPLTRAATGDGPKPHPGTGVEPALDERPERVVLFSRDDGTESRSPRRPVPEVPTVSGPKPA
jgi:hypothetical protein